MRLEIFVEAGCTLCDRAATIAKEIGQRFPGVRVALIDMAQIGDDLPDSVFAVPTYLLDGQLVSLGNPRLEDLASLIESKRTRESA